MPIPREHDECPSILRHVKAVLCVEGHWPSGVTNEDLDGKLLDRRYVEVMKLDTEIFVQDTSGPPSFIMPNGPIRADPLSSTRVERPGEWQAYYRRGRAADEYARFADGHGHVSFDGHRRQHGALATPTGGYAFGPRTTRCDHRIRRRQSGRCRGPPAWRRGQSLRGVRSRFGCNRGGMRDSKRAGCRVLAGYADAAGSHCTTHR